MRIILCLLLCELLGCMSLPSGQVLQQNPQTNLTGSETEGSLEIFIPYVGQGDGSLILFPNGKTLLIDSGPAQTGPQALLDILGRLNLSSLDALLITHYDWDHLGGVPDLVAGKDGQLGTEDDIRIGTAWDRGTKPYDSSPGLASYREVLAEKQIPLLAPVLGEDISLDPTVKLRVVAIDGRVGSNDNFQSTDLSLTTYAEKENAACIALLLEYGSFSYLTSGDLTGGGYVDGFLTPDLESLVADQVGQVKVLHVNHHGSKSSSNPVFVSKTHPQAVFIQAGVDNSYGHPVPEVVDRWENIGAEIFSTAQGQGFYLSADDAGHFQIGDLGDFFGTK